MGDCQVFPAPPRTATVCALTGHWMMAGTPASDPAARSANRISDLALEPPSIGPPKMTILLSFLLSFFLPPCLHSQIGLNRLPNCRGKTIYTYNKQEFFIQRSAQQAPSNWCSTTRHMRPCHYEEGQAVPFAHIAEELMQVALRINAWRGSHAGETPVETPPSDVIG
jgi:hypothetical protein